MVDFANDKVKSRSDKLFALEMKFNGESYVGKHKYNEDFNVHWTEITCNTDTEFEAIIVKLENELKKRKEL